MKNFLIALVVLSATFLFALSPIQAAPIGTVTSFKGEVIIQKGTTFIPVRQIGQTVDTGDRIQTRNSEVAVTFNDGAVLKLRPFSNASVDERNEESGFWVFKSKKPVRRLNVFIGKMRFKSGSSHRENILQTPTSVCALRGSEAEVGYNNIDSMLKMYAGQPFITGKFIRGFFNDPGIGVAAKNQVYRSLEKAFKVEQQATTPVEKAKARLAALQVQKQAAVEFMKNADPKVKKDARLAAVVADAAIAAQKARVHLEKIKQEQQENPDQKNDEAVKKAEQAFVAAAAAAKEAAKAAEAVVVDAAERAAAKAKGQTTSTVLTTTSSSSSSSSSSTTTEETTRETTVDTTTVVPNSSTVTPTTTSSIQPTTSTVTPTTTSSIQPTTSTVTPTTTSSIQPTTSTVTPTTTSSIQPTTSTVTPTTTSTVQPTTSTVTPTTTSSIQPTTSTVTPTTTSSIQPTTSTVTPTTTSTVQPTTTSTSSSSSSSTTEETTYSTTEETTYSCPY